MIGRWWRVLRRTQRLEHSSSGGEPGAGREERKKEGQCPFGDWASSVSSDVPLGT